MFKFIIILNLLMLSTSCFDKTSNNDIESAFTEYWNALRNKEFEKAAEYVYIPPEILKKFSEKNWIEIMSVMYDGADRSVSEVIVTIAMMNILKTYDSQKIENKYYSLLTYSIQIDWKWKKKIDINEAKLYLEKIYGAKNVKYNEKTKFFEIQYQTDVYGISENGETDWKFIIGPTQKVVEETLPREVIEKEWD